MQRPQYDSGGMSAFEITSSIIRRQLQIMTSVIIYATSTKVCLIVYPYFSPDSHRDPEHSRIIRGQKNDECFLLYDNSETVGAHC